MQAGVHWCARDCVPALLWVRVYLHVPRGACVDTVSYGMQKHIESMSDCMVLGCHLAWLAGALDCVCFGNRQILLVICFMRTVCTLRRWISAWVFLLIGGVESIVFGPIRWCVWSFRPSSPLRLPHLKFLFVCLFFLVLSVCVNLTSICVSGFATPVVNCGTARVPMGLPM